MGCNFRSATNPKKQLIIATRNPDKLREIRAVLSDLKLEFLSLIDFPDLPEIEEDGQTIEENAIKKATEIHNHTGLPCLADDTGLEVDSLGGAPGVYSSRYAGETATYADNCRKLLEEMEGIPYPQRTAHFRCVMALVTKNKVITTEGVCEGYILTQMRGQNGFGYDPLFWVEPYGKTFAEMEPELKNRISHRAIALNKMKPHLLNLFSTEDFGLCSGKFK